MTRYVKAIFSDGTILTRSSETKVYTHAYLARGWYVVEQGWGDIKSGDRLTTTLSGFSGSADQATRNKAAESAWLRPGWRSRSRLHGKVPTARGVEFEEVVPVVEVDAHEYRETKRD